VSSGGLLRDVVAAHEVSPKPAARPLVIEVARGRWVGLELEARHDAARALTPLRDAQKLACLRSRLGHCHLLARPSPRRARPWQEALRELHAIVRREEAALASPRPPIGARQRPLRRRALRDRGDIERAGEVGKARVAFEPVSPRRRPRYWPTRGVRRCPPRAGVR